MTQVDPPSYVSDDRPKSIGAVIARVTAKAEIQDKITLQEMIAALGSASFAPILLLPALVVVTPLSGIPLLSSICGIGIALIAGQMLVGRRHLWLPHWIRARSIKSARLIRALHMLDRPARWIDRITSERLSLLVHAPFRQGLLILCMACGLSMPMLELVPMSSSILAGAVVLMSLAIIVEDGVLAAIGLASVGGGASLAAMFIA